MSLSTQGPLGFSLLSIIMELCTYLQEEWNFMLPKTHCKVQLVISDSNIVDPSHLMLSNGAGEVSRATSLDHKLQIAVVCIFLFNLPAIKELITNFD